VLQRSAIVAIALAAGQPARVPDIFFVPTTYAAADAMLQLAGVNKDDIVYDLGSGDGRIVILAAQKYGARGVGIELEPSLVAQSRQTAHEGEVADRVTFIEGDLFTADISKATVVTLYLSPNVNRRLEPKLRTELKPGTRVVSQQFPMPAWAPTRTVTLDERELFLWVVGR
jgi:SAM-dependent methyltransferase